MKSTIRGDIRAREELTSDQVEVFKDMVREVGLGYVVGMGNLAQGILSINTENAKRDGYRLLGSNAATAGYSSHVTFEEIIAHMLNHPTLASGFFNGQFVVITPNDHSYPDVFKIVVRDNIVQVYEAKVVFADEYQEIVPL